MPYKVQSLTNIQASGPSDPLEVFGTIDRQIVAIGLSEGSALVRSSVDGKAWVEETTLSGALAPSHNVRRLLETNLSHIDVVGSSMLCRLTRAWQIDDPGGSPSFVEETADFAEATANDVEPWPAVEAVGDQFAIGFERPFSRVSITVGTAGVGGTLAVKYWDGSALVAVSGLSDATNGFTTGGANEVSFDEPSDWVAQQLNSTNDRLYYLYFEVATGYGTNPLLSEGSLPDFPQFELVSFLA